MRNIAIFASGTGSNFDAIYNSINEKKLNAHISLFVSDKPNSKSASKASNYGIDSYLFTPKDFSSKSEFEKEILQLLEEKNIELIVLAGYMRIIGKTLLEKYSKRIINIHPSLLPAFKGIDAIGQAINAHVKVMGVTVHYVDEGMDTGEIIDQEALYVGNMTTRDEIEQSIHSIEHILYPRVIKKLLEDSK